MKPLVEGLSSSYGGRIEFRRLNVETDQNAIALANTLGLQYVPTFVYVNTDGAIAKTVVGEQTEPAMRAALDALK